MPNDIPVDGNVPIAQTKQKRVRSIIVILCVALLVILGSEVWRRLSETVRQSVEPTSDVMAKIHLASQCQEFNSNLSWEECGQWSVGLKRDHPINFRECVGDPNDEVLPLDSMYDCFVRKGLGP